MCVCTHGIQGLKLSCSVPTIISQTCSVTIFGSTHFLPSTHPRPSYWTAAVQWDGCVFIFCKDWWYTAKRPFCYWGRHAWFRQSSNTNRASTHYPSFCTAILHWCNDIILKYYNYSDWTEGESSVYHCKMNITEIAPLGKMDHSEMWEKVLVNDKQSNTVQCIFFVKHLVKWRNIPECMQVHVHIRKIQSDQKVHLHDMFSSVEQEKIIIHFFWGTVKLHMNTVSKRRFCMRHHVIYTPSFRPPVSKLPLTDVTLKCYCWRILESTKPLHEKISTIQTSLDQSARTTDLADLCKPNCTQYLFSFTRGSKCVCVYACRQTVSI